jgi:hypothetical protein
LLSLLPRTAQFLHQFANTPDRIEILENPNHIVAETYAFVQLFLGTSSEGLGN